MRKEQEEPAKPIARKEPIVAPQKAKSEETSQDDFDIFSWLESGGQIEGAVTEESHFDNSFGQNGLVESQYPKALRLTDREKKRMASIEKYFSGEGLGKKEQPSVAEMDAVNGLLDMDGLKAKRAKYRARMSEAEVMIEQRKAEGYKGKTKSYAEYKAVMDDLLGADEFEKGEILAASAVGEKGIRYWQLQRKSAERELKKLDFAEKIIKRRDFAEKESRKA